MIKESTECFRIYDTYNGLNLDQTSGKKASDDFDVYNEKLAGNFYYRVFSESFDFVFFYGDIYFSTKKDSTEHKIFLVDEINDGTDFGCSSIKAFKDDDMPSGFRYFALGGNDYE